LVQRGLRLLYYQREAVLAIDESIRRRHGILREAATMQAPWMTLPLRLDTSATSQLAGKQTGGREATNPVLFGEVAGVPSVPST
jgi:hypothetical protein